MKITQAQARNYLRNPERIKSYLYGGGNARQRRKDRRDYIRNLAIMLMIADGLA